MSSKQMGLISRFDEGEISRVNHPPSLRGSFLSMSPYREKSSLLGRPSDTVPIPVELFLMRVFSQRTLGVIYGPCNTEK